MEGTPTHNTKGRYSASLDTFGGIVTLADPTNLPEGASPRNQNIDFNVGSAFTRQGLMNPFIYQNAAAGPGPGQTVTVVDTGGSSWTSPDSVLVDNETFAYATLPAPGVSIVAITPFVTQTNAGVPWSNLSALINGVGFASAPVSIYVASNVATVTVKATSLPASIVVRGITVSFESVLIPGSPAGAIDCSFGAAVKSQTMAGGSYTLGSSTDAWGTSFSSSDLGRGVDFTISPRALGADTSITMGKITVTIYYSPTLTDAIHVEEFGFSVPSSATPQGFEISVLGYSSAPSMLNIQLLKAGVPAGDIRNVALQNTPTTVMVGGINDLFGASWIYSDLNNTDFGVRLSVSSPNLTTVFVGYTTVTAFFTPTQENFNYVTTFEDDFGNIKNISLDDTGQFWVENLTTDPGVLAPLFSGPPQGSFASSFTADSRQYFAISDLLQGNYPPQQYNGQWHDRVSQVGPGASPTFTPITTGADEFPIATITQPAAQSRGSSYFLQSTGPGSTAAGNVVTVYYADSTGSGPDNDLVNAFNSGYPVYIYFSFTGGPTTQGPYTVRVTSVNLGQPPGQPRQFYYFTFDVLTSVYTYYEGSGHPGYTANYQRTLSTMVTSVPVPGLSIGGQARITGASISDYDATWTISQTPNSGQFTVTATQVAGGIATFTYSLISGVDPVAGQLITTTGTTNANGQLNLVNAVIVSATGTQFTVNVSLADAPSASEQGQASSAGTIFAFDPGALVVNTATNPIYGPSTGGDVVFEGHGQVITAGTRRGTVFFITRNGYYTRPAPPVTFTCPEGTVSIQVSNIPIGPPNVIARGIAFTEAGPDQVPGANYFWLFEPVEYVVTGTTYTATATRIQDNTSTTATLTFTDAVLLAGEQINADDFDLFNLGELGDAAWCTQYAGRTVWGRVRNTVHNFENLSFDGGYLANPGGNILPTYWDLDASTASSTLINSPVFGQSYYIRNSTGSTQAVLGMITQSAYHDWNEVAILQNQTSYSVRVTARTPSSATVGSLVIDLTTYDQGTGYGKTYGSFVLPLASMSSTMLTYEGALLTTDTLNIPENLVLRVFGQNLADGGDIEIDRIVPFPTIAPTNLTGVQFSYANDNESFDLVTGGNDTSVMNSQPANGGFVMHNDLYIVKESSLGLFSDNPNAEPANWNPFSEVSNVAGASGINAFDVGEEWAVMGCQKGLFLFNGGAPHPIQLEIPDIWKAINWQYGHTMCIRNDVANRKIFCAIPLPTPNPWMPDTEVNANPTRPNVVLMLNYAGIGNIEELMSAISIHVTNTGNLAALDFRRKWSLWTVKTPYMGVIKRNELFSEMLFCNGNRTSKIYYLGSEKTGKDDGANFRSTYCTFGFVDAARAEQVPLLGDHNKRFAYYDLLASGSGTADMTFYQNVLEAPYPFEVPGGVELSDPAANDIEGPLDEYSQRLFVEFGIDEGWFNLSRLTLVGARDKWANIRGK